MGFSLHKCVMETCHVQCSNRIIFDPLLVNTADIYCHPKRMRQQENCNHYGTLYMATGGSMPYSQSVGVRCNLEDVKLIRGSIQTSSD